MTETMVAAKAAPADCVTQSLPAEKYGWAIPLLLGVGVLLAILASLCIGAFPMSFWQAARNRDASGLAGASSRQSALVSERNYSSAGHPLATCADGDTGRAGTWHLRHGAARHDAQSVGRAGIVGVSSGAAFGGVLAMIFDIAGRESLGWLSAADCWPWPAPLVWPNWRKQKTTA